MIITFLLTKQQVNPKFSNIFFSLKSVKFNKSQLFYKKKTILGAEHSISHCFIINNKYLISFQLHENLRNSHFQ